MVIKTLKFDSEFVKYINDNIYFVKDRYGRPIPPQIRGSYIRSPINGIITDIDIRVNVGTRPPSILRKIIASVFTRKDRLTFSYLWVGFTTDITPPWQIGDVICKYNKKESQSWFESHAGLFSGIIDTNQVDEIRRIVDGDSISQADLLRINSILYPHINLYWTIREIEDGVKNVRGVQYWFDDLFYKQDVLTIRALFEYENEFVPIDLTLRRLLKEPFKDTSTSNLTSAYLDWYRQLKLFKYDLNDIENRVDLHKNKFSESPTYNTIYQSIVKEVSLKYVIDDMDSALKYGYVSERKEARIKDYIFRLAKSFSIREQTIPLILNRAIEHINKSCREAIPLLLERTDKKLPMHFKIYMKALGALESIPLELIQRRESQRLACPFDAFQDSDYDWLLDVYQRTKLEYVKLSRCLTEEEIKTGKPIEELRKTLFSNDMRIEIRNSEAILSERNRIIKTVPIEQLSILQRTMLETEGV